MWLLGMLMLSLSLTELAQEREVMDKRLAALCKRRAPPAVTPVDHHICPPTAVGSRRAGLVHKLHALLHSLLLENHLFAGLRQFLSQVRAVTTDFGTEIGFAEARNIQLSSLFPGLLEFDFKFCVA